MKRLLIVGGGITGLSAAWNAMRSGARDLEITVVEREDRLGGKIRTDFVQGCLLEQGPDSFLTSRPEALLLCEELGIDGRLQPRLPRSVPSYIAHQHVLSPLPEGFSVALPMDTAALAVSPLLSEAGRRRALKEPALPAWSGGDDESVASFMVRKFGEEAYELLVEPLVGGIHAGDASLLSVQATLPRRPTGGVGKRPQFLTLPGGMVEMIAALEERLSGVRIVRGTGVDAVRRRGNGCIAELSDGDKVEADALILALPAHEAARLTEPLHMELSELIRLIPSASTVVIHMAWPRDNVPHPLDGYGYLIPSVERSDLVACTWTSQKWENRAPEGTVLVRLFAGRFGRRDLLGTRDEELFSLARAEVQATLGIRSAPQLELIHRWGKGMPQYTVGHLGRVEDIRARAADLPGIFLAGAAFDGVGIPQCVASGASAAASAVTFLEDGK
jgi:protoporphyrinogen/coproporphyrinogen III oxidase